MISTSSSAHEDLTASAHFEDGVAACAIAIFSTTATHSSGLMVLRTTGARSATATAYWPFDEVTLQSMPVQFSASFIVWMSSSRRHDCLALHMPLTSAFRLSSVSALSTRNETKNAICRSPSVTGRVLFRRAARASDSPGVSGRLSRLRHST